MIGQLACKYFHVLMTSASLDNLTTMGIQGMSTRMRKVLFLHLRELGKLKEVKVPKMTATS